MGVYIEGMEMPKGCAGCPIDSDSCELWTQLPATSLSNTRHEDCPLVPVPPHGRLGDLDEMEIYHREEVALKAYKENPDSEYFEGIKDAWHEAAKLLSTAPTIIPASEEGET